LLIGITKLRWEKLPRPWTKEQCRRRYVEADDDIGIRGLADASGQSKGTVEGWVKRELWLDQRRQYRDTLKTTIQEKTIEKTSEKISDELSDIVIENYKVHKLARDYVAKIIEVKARQLAEDLKLVGEEKKKAIAQHNAAEVNQWSQALKRSTDAINEVRGIKYFIDINAAADKLSREGYEIIDPSEKPNEQTDD
jgi:histone H3/H4